MPFASAIPIRQTKPHRTNMTLKAKKKYFTLSTRRQIFNRR